MKLHIAVLHIFLNLSWLQGPARVVGKSSKPNTGAEHGVLQTEIPNTQQSTSSTVVQKAAPNKRSRLLWSWMKHVGWLILLDNMFRSWMKWDQNFYACNLWMKWDQSLYGTLLHPRWNEHKTWYYVCYFVCHVPLELLFTEIYVCLLICQFTYLNIREPGLTPQNQALHWIPITFKETCLTSFW